MIVRASAEWPEIFPVRLFYRQIVDAGVTELHQAIRIEFPVFVAVGAKPISAVVAPLVGKPDGDPVFVERPKFLDQPIVELFRPLSREKLDDRLPACDKLRAITPHAVER